MFVCFLSLKGGELVFITGNVRSNKKTRPDKSEVALQPTSFFKFGGEYKHLVEKLQRCIHDPVCLYCCVHFSMAHLSHEEPAGMYE